jgi:hypothetical protein
VGDCVVEEGEDIIVSVDFPGNDRSSIAFHAAISGMLFGATIVAP